MASFVFGTFQTDTVSLFSVGLWGIGIGLVFSVLALLAIGASRFGSRPTVTVRGGRVVQGLKQLEP